MDSSTADSTTAVLEERQKTLKYESAIMHSSGTMEPQLPPATLRTNAKHSTTTVFISCVSVPPVRRC